MASIKRIGKDQFDIPIWEAVYRRTPGGKQVRKRFHLPTKAMVEREVILDSGRSDIGLKWSEGIRLYMGSKRMEGLNPEGLVLVERAANTFLGLIGDMAIEETTAGITKEFMRLVVEKSGPKVANHHCKALKMIARYLRGHTDKLTAIPFEHVPMLPVKRSGRSPIPTGQINQYMNALPLHVRRPVMMVLYYGLRSTATCNLKPTPPTADYLEATDKGGVERKIPVDDMLRGILKDAEEFRRTFPEPAENLFLTTKGKAWDKRTIRLAAQKAWAEAGLDRKKIHEIRHTLGTLASRSFNPRMVQAAMGHRDEKSAAVYFHPNEEMAAEVRHKIITELSRDIAENFENHDLIEEIMYTKNGEYSCPNCHCKLFIYKEKDCKS